MKTLRRQLVQVGDVFQAIFSGPIDDMVNLKIFRNTTIDA